MTELLLRYSILEDCKHFAEWESTEEVTRFFSIGKDWSYDDVKSTFLTDEKDGSKRQFTICETVDDTPVGRIYVTSINNYTHSLDITRIYIGDLTKRGKGYGRQAMELILDWAFNHMKAHRVTLNHFPGNKKAANLYLSLGFKYEGIARDAAFKDGKYYNLEGLSILEAEYRTFSKKNK